MKHKLYAFLFIFVFMAGFYAWLIFTNDLYWKMLVADVLTIIAAVVSSLWLLGAYRKGTGMRRKFWLFLFLGCQSWSFGEIMWLFYEFILKTEVPSPGWADLFYLLQIVFYMIAFIYKLYERKGSFQLLRFVFDTMIIMTVATAFSWHFMLIPLYTQSGVAIQSIMVSMAYPIGDLVLLFGAVSIFFASERFASKTYLLFLFLGLILQISADSAYLYLSAVNRYLSGSLFDPLWSLSGFFIGLSALFSNKESRDNEVSTSLSKFDLYRLDLTRMTVPYISVAILFISMVWYNDGINSFIIGTAIAITLIIVRQIVTLIQNKTLLQRLTQLNERLGEIVNHRTKELSEKNELLEEAMKNMQHLAFHDVLTGLPNRRLFEDRLGQALARAKRNNRIVAVLFVDLDRFKNVNDSLGHHIGDLLLRSVAERFMSVLRENDTISRQGGDEFIIILEGIVKADDVVKVIHKVQKLFEKPIILEKNEVHISMSIGVALYPHDGFTPQTLMKNADNAMYRAKETGKNNYYFYTSDMNYSTSRKLELENDLYKALDKKQFVLNYQPQIDIVTGQIVGTEALIRWVHPRLGVVPPSEFIPLAEETGLIIPISSWVLETACKQNKAWHDAGYANLKIAVNVSPRFLQYEDVIDIISDKLQKSGLQPGYLDLEITETVAMTSVESVISKFSKLKELGVQISIDDFGVGYSSLNYLKKFPINTLKIDKTFVNDIDTKQEGDVIVNAILAMANSLKFNVIAEGVETQSQLNYLKQKQCGGAQGFYFSKPLPANEMMQVLQLKRMPLEAQ